jgi:hypothetical protein
MGAGLAGPGYGVGRAGARLGMGAYRAGAGAGQIASLAFQGMGRESLSMLGTGLRAGRGFGRSMTQAYNSFKAMR